MALLSLQDVDAAGASITTQAAAASGDTFNNADERVQFYVVNTSGVTRTITISAVGECSHGFVHDTVQAVLNNETWTFGPFDRGRFNDSQGIVSVTYDNEAGLAVAAIRDLRPPTR